MAKAVGEHKKNIEMERLHGRWQHVAVPPQHYVPGKPASLGIVVLTEGSIVIDGAEYQRLSPFDNEPPPIRAWLLPKYRSDVTLEGDGVLVTSPLLPVVDKPQPLNVVKKSTRGTSEDGNLRDVWLLHETGVVLGETLHATRGSWSSWPAHSFELQTMLAHQPPLSEPFFYEQFYYRTDPVMAWAMAIRRGWMPPDAPDWGQNRWMSDIVTLGDGAIIDMPLGFHANIAMPGALLYYVWAYVGGGVKD